MYLQQPNCDQHTIGDKLSATRLLRPVNAGNGRCIHPNLNARTILPIAYKMVSLLLIFFMHSIGRAHAQHEADYAVHANIIYHFTKYIDWPEEKKNGFFVIGVSGDTPLFDELQNHIAGKMVGRQKIIIRKLSSTVSPYNCHILFVSDDESNSLKKLAARTAGSPILIVSESEGLAEKGSCINFKLVSNHLKLEINKNTIGQRNLSIASELLKLGKVVK